MTVAARPAGRTRRVWKNTALYVLSQGGAGIAGFITSVVLANHLGVSGYGAYAFIFSATTLFTFAADLGLSFYAFCEASRSHAWLERNYLPMLCLKAVAGGVLVALSYPAIKILPLPADAAGLLPLGFTVLALNSLNGAAYSVFRAYERAGFQAATVVLNRLTVLLLIVLFLVPMHRGIHEILMVMVITGTAVFAVNQLLVHRLCPGAFSGFGSARKLLYGALPFMAVTFFNQLYLHVDMSMLTLMQGTGAAGIYAIPARLLAFGIILPAAFVNALFPALNRLRNSDDLSGTVTGGLRTMLPFALPVAVCGALMAGSFMSFFYDGAFAPAVVCMRIMAVTLGVMSVNWLLGHVLYARGHGKTMLKVVAGAVGVNMLLNAAVIPRFGSAGAAGATLVTELFILITELRLVTRDVKIGWRLLQPVKALVCTVAAAVPMAVLKRYLPFPAVAATGFAMYVAASWRMGLLRSGAVRSGEGKQV